MEPETRGTLGQGDLTNGISIPHIVSSSSARSALHPGAHRQIALNSLKTGLEIGQVVFLAPVLLSTGHAARTLNVLSLNSLKSLQGRFYGERH